MLGDCRESLKRLDDASVDSVVCDPPYHLTSIVKRFGAGNAAPAKVGATGAYARASKGFMGQTWDGGDVAFLPETWAEILRVLKPGGHLVAFSGSRTYHRMTVAIEDAGFEIRDQIMWIYGSGFPKSHNVANGIDKLHGAPNRGHRIARASGVHPDATKEPSGDNLSAYEARTDQGQGWEGWGTALKPAHEPICLARKPMVGTVAANVLAHGTGAINIDGCRIHADDAAGYAYQVKRTAPGATQNATGKTKLEGVIYEGETKPGRWPANICHDGSDEVLVGFPDKAGAAAPVHRRNADKFRGTYGAFKGNVDESGSTFQGDSGSAARFFYCAKTSASERGDGNGHPTVKPIALMAWLCRLVTPKGGLVLDPFTGSGSTAIAALAEGFSFVGCELSSDYAEIARRRIEAHAGMFAKVTIE